MAFLWSLSDKSPQVSRTLLCILAVVWIVSTRTPTIKFSSPLSNPLVTVPITPVTIGIIVTYMFHSFFFQFPSKGSLFQFYYVVSRDSKVHNFASFLFLLIIIRAGVLAEIRWSVFMSKSHRSLCVSFCRIEVGLCIYHFFVWSNFLHISLWITLPNQPCLVLYSFCANLLHSLIMW